MERETTENNYNNFQSVEPIIRGKLGYEKVFLLKTHAIAVFWQRLRKRVVTQESLKRLCVSLEVP